MSAENCSIQFSVYSGEPEHRLLECPIKLPRVHVNPCEIYTLNADFVMSETCAGDKSHREKELPSGNTLIYFFKPATQFRITVTGVWLSSSTGELIRKR